MSAGSEVVLWPFQGQRYFIETNVRSQNDRLNMFSHTRHDPLAHLSKDIKGQDPRTCILQRNRD